MPKKKKKRRVKKKHAEPQFEEASLRDHLLAGAYGGVAKPKPKRAGLKYTTDIDAGLKDMATPVVARELLVTAGNVRRGMDNFPRSPQAIQSVGSDGGPHS